MLERYPYCHRLLLGFDAVLSALAIVVESVVGFFKVYFAVVVSFGMMVSFGMVIGIGSPRKWGFLPKRMSRTALVRASFSRKYMRMRQYLEMVFLALKATALIPR